jgi:hypothetical protein
MAKETVSNRRYTDAFRLEALRLAESVGINQENAQISLKHCSP